MDWQNKVWYTFLVHVPEHRKSPEGDLGALLLGSDPRTQVGATFADLVPRLTGLRYEQT